MDNLAVVTPKRRPAAAMYGHACALSFKQHRADVKDYAAIRSYVSLKYAVHRSAWMGPRRQGKECRRTGVSSR